MSKRGLCPICLTQGAILTDEDVTPKWVRAILAERLPNPAVRPVKTTVRICSDCNGQLNRTFEIPCRSIVETLIRGDKGFDLSREQMTLVSAWLSKTTLVRLVGDPAFALQPESMAWVREALVSLIREGVPEPFISVRIAYYDQAIEQPTKLLLPPPRPFAIPPRVKSPRNVNAIPSLGYLKWEFLMSLENDPATIAPLARVEADAGRLLRIWPLPEVRASVCWPPAITLNTEAVLAHRAAWRVGTSETYFEKAWR